MDGSSVFTQLRLRAAMHKYVTISLTERYEQRSILHGKLIDVSLNTITLLVDRDIYVDKKIELPIQSIFKVIENHEKRT